MDRPSIFSTGALAGIRVVDFTWVRAGPQSTRIFGAFGAEVIRVEWPQNPDMIRLGAGMTPDGLTPSPNTSGDFNNFSAGKLSVTLNVRHPKGLDLIKRLIAISDVVIENFSGHVMESWGLGWENLKQINPRLVYVSMAGFGHSGRDSNYTTYGPSVQALSGLTHVSGLPGKQPAGWGYSYMDHTGGYYGAMAVLAALHYLNRTGIGQYVDMSQVEAGSTLTGAAILDYTVNGRSTRREGFPMGNRTHWPGTPITNGYRGPHAAPHNAYRTAGSGYNDWCAIACFNNEEWQALVEVMGNPQWAQEPKFSTLLSRLENQEELDAQVQAWTLTLNKYEVMERLQAAGVAAAPVQSQSDRVERDPQLKHRGTFQTKQTHPLLGERIFEGMPMKLSETNWEIWRSAPLLGEHNDYVFGELLGVPPDEMAALGADGVFWPSGMMRE